MHIKSDGKDTKSFLHAQVRVFFFDKKSTFFAKKRKTFTFNLSPFTFFLYFCALI